VRRVTDICVTCVIACTRVVAGVRARVGGAVQRGGAQVRVVCRCWRFLRGHAVSSRFVAISCVEVWRECARDASDGTKESEEREEREERGSNARWERLPVAFGCARV
jgi:hypothetical protein